MFRERDTVRDWCWRRVCSGSDWTGVGGKGVLQELVLRESEYWE